MKLIMRKGVIGQANHPKRPIIYRFHWHDWHLGILIDAFWFWGPFGKPLNSGVQLRGFFINVGPMFINLSKELD